MAVFVDQLKQEKWLFYNESCHLFADTEVELHKLAFEIGLRRVWFQKDPPHYDLVPSKRALAIEAGAIEITTKEYLKRRKVWT